jgi:hypothetical protein
MDTKSGIKMKGLVEIWKVLDPEDESNRELLVRTTNIITCGGCAFMAGYLSGGTMTDMSCVVPGSGSTSEVTGNTALENEIGGVAGDRNASDIDAPTSCSVRFSSSYEPGAATGNWYEVGIFNSTVAAGLMLARTTFGLLTKAAGDTFIVEYTISFADDGA